MIAKRGQGVGARAGRGIGGATARSRPRPGRRAGPVAAGLIVGALAGTGAGCSTSFPPGGPTDLVLGMAVRSPDARAERRVVPGLDLRLRPDAGGFSVGWTDVQWARPSTGAAPRAGTARWHYAPPLGLGREWRDGTRQAIGWVAVPPRHAPGEVSLRRATELGAGLRFGAMTRGLLVGLSRSLAVSVLPDQDVLVLARCAARGLLPCQIDLVEQEPNP